MVVSVAHVRLVACCTPSRVAEAMKEPIHARTSTAEPVGRRSMILNVSRAAGVVSAILPRVGMPVQTPASPSSIPLTGHKAVIYQYTPGL